MLLAFRLLFLVICHRFLHLDIDDVRNIIPISHTGFVDEFYMIDTLHVERKQIVTELLLKRQYFLLDVLYRLKNRR